MTRESALPDPRPGAHSTRPAGRASRPRCLWQRCIPSGSSLSHIAKLVSATSVAQGLLVASAPFLTRIYRPADFAVFALFGACMNLLVSIGAGRYEFAMMLPKRRRQAGQLFFVALMLSALTAVATLALVAACQALQRWNWLTNPGAWIWFIPLGVIGYCWYSVVAKWQSRRQHFTVIAVAEVTTAVVAIAFQVAVGLTVRAPGGTHLVLGQVLGRIVGTLVLAIAASGDLHQCWAELSLHRMLAVTRRFWKFPVFNGGAILLGIATHELPKLMLYCFFPHQILGFFSLSMRTLGAPTALVGKAVGDVFFPRVSATRENPQQARKLLRKTSLGLFLFVLPLMLVVFISAESLFGYVFGEQWRAAGTYARLLIPLLTIHFVVSPVQHLLQVFEKQFVVFSWQTCHMVVCLLAFLAVSSSGTAEQAILSYSTVSTAMYALLLFLCFHYAQPSLPKPKAPNGSQGLARSPAASACGDPPGLTR